MEFSQLLQVVGTEPLFETGLLLAGAVNPRDVRRRSSRWTATGKLCQLRRGLYTLAAPFRKTIAHPFYVADHLVRASYVSCQSALAYSGLIPEYTPVVVSVTTGRPGRWDTALGVYDYHHVQTDFWRGYRSVDLGAGQQAFVAAPEKALLDLAYLQPGADSQGYLQELRLRNLEV